ncbi:hypothetical protein HID58_080108 [Brassica napus]|uniref:Uncharacterized protein n=1 Tax=Brassica napus TaxID=3708 RepID=A0ABQ7Y3Y9_BRANA|nr:hypothetical protein HID58_080108 [Brassica napus]
MDVGVKAHGLAKRIVFFQAVREETGSLSPMEMAKEMVVEVEIRREAMFVEVWKRNGLTECGVTYPGGVEQSCLILWSPHTGERNPETLSNTIMENLQRLVSELKAGRYRETIVIKLLHLWEAKNMNKGGDFMAVYIALVDENVYFS